MIRTERAHLRVAARTHPGLVRKVNEDRYAVSAYRLGGRGSAPVLLAVLADGIGGHRAGEVAAEMGVEGISRAVAERGVENPLGVLRRAVEDASQQIFEQARKDESLNGMGATCACALVIQERLYTATVGDSRIYLYRGRSLRQVSTDHTWVQEAVERGLLRKEQAQGHPNAHVIRRFLGAPTPPEVDFRLRLREGESDEASSANQGLRLAPGDRVLLCSDGLTDLVSAAEIETALQNPNLEETADRLLALALDRGGHDNTTLVGLEMPTRRAMAALLAPPPDLRRRAAALGCATVFMIALAAGLYLGRNALGGLLWPAEASPTPTIAPQLLTVIPGRTSTVAPAYPPPFGTLGPLATPTRGGPTLTPWPTSTLPPAYP